MPFEHTILITCQNEAIGLDGILGVLREQLVEATTKFQPCGVNSGSNPSFPDPPAHGQPQFANGTDLPATTTTTWKLGSVVDAEWSIYANHGGGYSYRLCKKIEGKDVTEECFQQTPLNFANDFTTIKYYDGTREPFDIKATTTDLGTWPKGSQWRKNPIPMCNCDIGVGCSSSERKTVVSKSLPEHAVEMIKYEFIKDIRGNYTASVKRSQCGDITGRKHSDACLVPHTLHTTANNVVLV